jgi:hypothetical protein
LGQTAEHVPAKWHLHTPCSVSTRSSLSLPASSLASCRYLYSCASAWGPGKTASVELVGHAELQRPHFMQYVNWTKESRSFGVIRYSPLGESCSCRSPFLTRWGKTAACLRKKGSRSTTRSLTMGKLSIGWTVIVDEPRSAT